MYCTDSDNCVSFSDNTLSNFIFKTNDKGKTWKLFKEIDRVNTTEIKNLHSAYIYSVNNYYLAYSSSLELDISTDGGISFVNQKFDKIDKSNSGYFNEIKMFDSLRGVGITYNRIIYTNDNWENYNHVLIPDSINPSPPLYFLDSNRVLFQHVEDYNPEFKLFDITKEEFSNFNKSKEMVLHEKNKYLVSLTFVNDSLGFACGFQNTGIADYNRDLIWKTTNGGIDWIKILDKEISPAFGLDRIEFEDEKHGITIGSWGKLLETKDGGETWEQIPLEKGMRTSISEIAWAGEYFLIHMWGRGIFRLEITTNIKVIRATENIRVRQADNTLQIAINDETHSEYKLTILDATGTIHHSESIASGVGFLYYDVPLDGLSTGVYFYSLDGNHGIVSTGKFIIVR